MEIFGKLLALSKNLVYGIQDQKSMYAIARSGMTEPRNIAWSNIAVPRQNFNFWFSLHKRLALEDGGLDM